MTVLHSPYGQRVLMVCSRPIPEVAESGREKTMRLIYDALAIEGDVEVLVLSSILQSRSIRGLFSMLVGLFRGFLSGSLMPLQSAIFWQSKHRETIEAVIDRFNPNTIYFDGVRTGVYLPGIRKNFRNIRLVCDFDDLMSRRMENLIRQGQPVSLGYLTKYVPIWIVQNFIQRLTSKVIPCYEAQALLGLEFRILSVADSVVLVSSVEAEHLKSTLPKGQVNKIRVIPPSMPQVSRIMPISTIDRFVFVGSDSLLQNRLTIEYLVDLWSRLKPSIHLHLYGRQKGDYARVANVIEHGFVDDIADAYLPGSVMLASSFVSGGVKTKVLEAFAYGIVVIGNQITFEGIDAPVNSLTMEAEALEDFLRLPELQIATLAKNAQTVIAKAREQHSPIRLSAEWRSVVWDSKGFIN